MNYAHICWIIKVDSFRTECKRSYLSQIAQNRGFSAFLHLLFPRLYKSGKKIYMFTTIIDVKFHEESKSKLRIRLPRKAKPENAVNFRKIIQLLVGKNDVEK